MPAISNAAIGSIKFDEQGSNPTTPSASDWKLYFKSDGLYVIDSTGTAVGPLGPRVIEQLSKTADYTLVLADSGKHIYKGSGAAVTITIPANGTVAFPIGTAITFVNDDTETLSIAITTDTLVLAGTGTTGTRSLAQYGVATALKIGTTRWIISGTGLT